MLPTIEEAEILLSEAYKMNPGPWVDHSRVVADCSRRVALNSSNIDPDKAYICGLLHDIGRRFGVTYLAHVIDGYHFLMNLGYDEAARICITHSFADKDIRSYIGLADVSEEDYNKIEKLITEYIYDDYDKLIQLCDSIAMPYGATELKIRMDDVESRYGYYPAEKRQEHYRIKEYFEKKMGKNLYQVVSDNKELWGK